MGDVNSGDHVMEGVQLNPLAAPFVPGDQLLLPEGFDWADYMIEAAAQGAPQSPQPPQQPQPQTQFGLLAGPSRDNDDDRDPRSMDR